MELQPSYPTAACDNIRRSTLTETLKSRKLQLESKNKQNPIIHPIRTANQAERGGRKVNQKSKSIQEGFKLGVRTRYV